MPDLIVSVATGGDYVVRAFDVPDNVKVISVKKQRKSTIVKENKLILFNFINKMPMFFADTLRRIEHYHRVRSFKKNKKRLKYFTNEGYDIPFYNEVENILVVDDAVDTGETLSCIIQSIKMRYPSAFLRSAALTTTMQKPITSPNYTLYRNVLLRFPWSKDYRE